MNAPTLFALPKSKRKPIPTPSADEIAARDMLTALWKRCARAVNQSMTQHAWRGRYKTVALDMVRAGVTIDRALAAHAAVQLSIGHPVYSLRVVQDELARIQARELSLSENQVVLEDGTVIEGNDCDPPTLAELIDSQSA